MIRILLTLCLLAVMSSPTRAANVVHAPGPNSGRLLRAAEHIFQLADGDKNGRLNPAEQAKGDLRAEKALRQLVHDNIIGGRIPLPVVAEPQLADPAAMTGTEFTQHFQALAAREDAALRASRVAKHQTPVCQPAICPAPVVVTVRGRERDKYGDDRLRDERCARDWHCRQEDGYYTPPQRYFQPNQVQSAPPTVFGGPASSGMPDPARSSGIDRGSGSKHEPTRIHEPPPRWELQHGNSGHGRK